MDDGERERFLTVKRALTAEQIASRDARRLKFKALWKTVAAMPETERIATVNRLGFVTCDGHSLSMGNQLLIALQLPGASVLGGFRQWLKHGRCVRKGEHGAMIWVPVGANRGAGESLAPEETAELGKGCGFIVGTVFDVGQTQEIENTPAVNDAVVEHAGELQPA